MKRHWHNPWPEARDIPLEALLLADANSTVHGSAGRLERLIPDKYELLLVGALIGVLCVLTMLGAFDGCATRRCPPWQVEAGTVYMPGHGYGVICKDRGAR